jgi:hypothetical protein
MAELRQTAESTSNAISIGGASHVTEIAIEPVLASAEVSLGDANTVVVANLRAAWVGQFVEAIKRI